MSDYQPIQELPEVALWRITWWEPPDGATTYPRKTTGGSKYWRGGKNGSADVIASTLEAAIAAVRAVHPSVIFTNAAKVSGTGLVLVAEEAHRG